MELFNLIHLRNGPLILIYYSYTNKQIAGFGPLWAPLGPLALIYFRILDPFGPFWDPWPLYFWDFWTFWDTFQKSVPKWVLFRPTLFEKVDLP